MIRRLRKFTLWTGTLLSLLIVVAFGVSAWLWVAFQVPTFRSPSVYLFAGSVTLVRTDAKNFVADKMSVPVVVERSLMGLSSWNHWGVEPGLAITVPLYAVFLAVAIPTLLVRRFVPRFARGHCRRCGHNLTDLTEARCPECGAGFEIGAAGPYCMAGIDGVIR